jgi:hypothetical protein
MLSPRTYRSPEPTSAAAAVTPSSKFIIKFLFVSNVRKVGLGVNLQA